MPRSYSSPPPPVRTYDDIYTERQLALTAAQACAIEETYHATLWRRLQCWRPSDCPGHIWARQVNGTWTCDNCPERRWTL
jgi:hypothetical protein